MYMIHYDDTTIVTRLLLIEPIAFSFFSDPQLSTRLLSTIQMHTYSNRIAILSIHTRVLQKALLYRDFIQICTYDFHV